MAAMTTQEAAARHRKVEHLKTIIGLLDTPVTVDDIEAWGDDQWAAATDAANALFRANHRPPSERTRRLVVDDLRERARLTAMSDVDLFGEFGA